jgi:predicted ribosome quality control (RQC) complex YloA/Tae2 family protein
MFVIKDVENKTIDLNNTNFAFFEKYFSSELNFGFIQKIQFLNTEEQFLKIKIRKEGKNKDLIVGEGICFICENNTESKKENKGFSLALNNLLENKKILNIKQINLEKIILFEFEKYNLYFEFFSKNNIVLTDKENKIIYQLFKEVWKDREIKKNSIYFPPKNINSILNYLPNVGDFDNSKTIVTNIIKNINIHPKVVELYLEKNKLYQNDFESFKKTINFFKHEFEKNDFLILKGIDIPNKFIPVNLNLDFLDFCEFNLNQLLNKNFEKIIFKNKNKNLNEVEIKKKNVNKILLEQQNALEKIKTKAEKNKILGDLIYRNYLFFENLKKDIILGKIKENTIFEIENLKIVYKKIDKRKQKIVFSIQ